ADQYVEPAGPALTVIAERPRVGRSPVRLELVDDLHGADFGRAGDRAPREGRADHIDRPRAGPQAALDRGYQVVDLGVALDRLGLRHHDRPISADAPQVVALQVDDHRQLGAVLVAGLELIAQARVLLRGRPPGPRPLDGPGNDPVT